MACRYWRTARWTSASRFRWSALLASSVRRTEARADWIRDSVAPPVKIGSVTPIEALHERSEVLRPLEIPGGIVSICVRKVENGLKEYEPFAETNGSRCS